MAGFTVTSVPDVVGGKVLSSNGNTSLTYTPNQGTRASVLDATNPKVLRNITLDNLGLVVYRGSAATVTPVFIPVAAILALAVSVNNNLSWVPTFTTNPASNSVNYGTATSYTVVVNSELSVTYQWQLSINGGNSWSNLSNTGVYTNVTTATMNISSVTGLGANQYRCMATNSLGSANSNAAILTVIDPAITVQPTNTSVVHGNSTTIGLTATGTATIAYAWHRIDLAGNDVAIASGTDGSLYSNFTTNTLGIGAGVTTSQNQFRYYCMVTSSGTPQTNKSTVVVLTVT